jgi:hypothetical protein
MRDDADETAFVILRTTQCCEASILKARPGVVPEWTEDIYMKSAIAKDVMQQVATCYFQPVPPKGNNMVSAVDKLRIKPADLFLFHHRRALETYTLCQPFQDLITYMNTVYGQQFSEADSLFERGLVTQAHVLKLFKPNEIVISRTHGRPAAFVLQEWPELNDEDWVTLNCWSFQADGSGFARKKTMLSVPPIGAAESEIRKLPAYPLRYAAEDLRESIQKHGWKQWELRTATQVTYQGWNVEKDQYFVSEEPTTSCSTLS